MRTASILRVAALIAFVQFLTHTAMFVTYVPAHGPDEVSVVQAMQTHHFGFSGQSRSYWDMYFGYGLFAAFNCLIEAAALWFLARMAQHSEATIRPLAMVFLVANVGYITLISKYFFPLPAVFDAVIAILMAVVVLKRSPEASDAELSSIVS